VVLVETEDGIENETESAIGSPLDEMVEIVPVMQEEMSLDGLVPNAASVEEREAGAEAIFAATIPGVTAAALEGRMVGVEERDVAMKEILREVLISGLGTDRRACI